MANHPRDSLRLALSGGGPALILGWLFVRMVQHGGNEQLCALILLLKAVGLLASAVLVLGTVDAPVFRRFCPRNPIFDCRKVIHSPAGKMFGLLHAADLGVLYFASTLLLLAFTVLTPDFYYYALLLAALNLLTLPYTLFSVAYQAFKVGKWCALCLIVQLVFWLEFWQFYPFLFGTPPRVEFRFELLQPLVLAFGLPLALWPLARRLLEKAYPPATGDGDRLPV
jgi:uncharacterized membrane protein